MRFVTPWTWFLLLDKNRSIDHGFDKSKSMSFGEEPFRLNFAITIGYLNEKNKLIQHDDEIIEKDEEEKAGDFTAEVMQRPSWLDAFEINSERIIRLMLKSIDFDFHRSVELWYQTDIPPAKNVNNYAGRWVWWWKSSRIFAHERGIAGSGWFTVACFIKTIAFMRRTSDDEV